MNAVIDLEKLRREQRAERDASIRERQAHDLLSLAKLRATNVLPPDDLLFRQLAGQVMEAAVVAAAPASPESGWTRPDVFKHLNSGGSRESLPSECAGFVQDYDNSGPWAKR
jgi:hypothetical protein